MGKVWILKVILFHLYGKNQVRDFKMYVKRFFIVLIRTARFWEATCIPKNREMFIPNELFSPILPGLEIFFLDA